MMNIIVVGAGYVGLVAACCLANSGHMVTCVETDKAKLKALGFKHVGIGRKIS